jgi:hypothetical protein
MERGARNGEQGTGRSGDRRGREGDGGGMEREEEYGNGGGDFLCFQPLTSLYSLFMAFGTNFDNPYNRYGGRYSRAITHVDSSLQ